ncbi:MAG: tRNA1(Val) (adenine(37)-N6)-methyltransferase [Lachnospiraceae bacterium]|nr:tRNA1(Val) (adenine(37)-N6)-methyltransferase [Lachnospiraceae bacterium]
MSLLKEGERIDDLERNGYSIIQDPRRFCFGMDAVLLSGFAKASRGENAIDLGTGTGIIPILMAAKTEAAHLTGVEIQEDSADMARRSVEGNGLSDRISILTADIKELEKIFPAQSFEVVTSNPPYMSDLHGLKNPELPKAIARHEVLLTFRDLAKQASWLLKNTGRFYLVHRPFRLVEIIETLTEFGLEPKRMKMVHSYADREASMVLIEAVKGGGRYLKMEKPLIIYEAPGKYTQEIYDIYGY